MPVLVQRSVHSQSGSLAASLNLMLSRASCSSATFSMAAEEWQSGKGLGFQRLGCGQRMGQGHVGYEQRLGERHVGWF